MTEKKNDKPWLFKKGQSGNPSGIPKDIVPLAQLQRASRQQFTEMLHGFAVLKVSQLKQILEDPNRTTMELVLARLYSKSINGSHMHINILLDRILGPVPKQLDITSDGQKTPIAAIVNNIDPDKLTDFVAHYRKRIEAQTVESLPALSEKK